MAICYIFFFLFAYAKRRFFKKKPNPERGEKKCYPEIFLTVRILFYTGVFTILLFGVLWISFEICSEHSLNFRLVPHIIVFLQNKMVYYIIAPLFGGYAIIFRIWRFFFPFDRFICEVLEGSMGWKLDHIILMRGGHLRIGDGRTLPSPSMNDPSDPSDSQGRPRLTPHPSSFEGREPLRPSRVSPNPSSMPEEAPSVPSDKIFTCLSMLNEKTSTLPLQANIIKHQFPTGGMPEDGLSMEKREMARAFYRQSFGDLVDRRSKFCYSRPFDYAMDMYERDWFLSYSVENLGQFRRIDPIFDRKVQILQGKFEVLVGIGIEWEKNPFFQFQILRAISLYGKRLETHPYLVFSGQWDAEEHWNAIARLAMEELNNDFSSLYFYKDILIPKMNILQGNRYQTAEEYEIIALQNLKKLLEKTNEYSTLKSKWYPIHIVPQLCFWLSDQEKGAFELMAKKPFSNVEDIVTKYILKDKRYDAVQWKNFFFNPPKRVS